MTRPVLNEPERLDAHREEEPAAPRGSSVLRNSRPEPQGGTSGGGAKGESSEVARLSKVMEFANLIVDQKSVEIKELKPVEVEALRRHFVPYVQQMKVIELRQKEFDLVKQRIDINAEVYMLYKQEVEASNQELLRD
ncbi:TNFAIP3-interacting protein 1 isoform X5 [Babesia caballi]|uniref:TNFAIP3-interacting protein 1 isoform X5 n=1 Tax=Babesia caballi TaxID=5871 RepID=A0AAV4LT47_BABCB|nr:TNFAIP3-interacting protein 1 isoform X5 [Babesia caballi]